MKIFSARNQKFKTILDLEFVYRDFENDLSRFSTKFVPDMLLLMSTNGINSPEKLILD